MNSIEPIDEATATPPLDRDLFLRRLVGELAHVLDDLIGLDEASGLISLVGRRMGDHINEAYIARRDGKPLDRAQVAQALVDLKVSIKGDFYIIEQDDDRIVLGNRACPFADQVAGRHALCMMTSNMFGSIAADHLGYARIGLERTIARGDATCRIVVHLRPRPDAAGEAIEYFRA